MDKKYLALFSLVACVLVAQEAPRETEDETIARCLQELKSTDVALRRRAILLAIKYDTPEVEQAVVASLQDSDEQVRQAALVSLTEERRLPDAARMPLFRMLRDPSVHIRRIASSMLPEAMGVMPRGALPFGLRMRAGGGHTPEEEAEQAECLNAGLMDSDASVRKNVLRGARFFSGSLSAAGLAVFFQDSDAEMRTLALNCFSKAEGARQEKVSILAPLAKDPQIPVRQALVQVASELLPESERVLNELAEDAVHEVSCPAILVMARAHLPGVFPKLVAKIRDDAAPVRLRNALAGQLHAFGDEARPMLEELLRGPDEELRITALRLLSGGAFGELSLASLLKLADDDSSAVRKQALPPLRRILAHPRLADLRPLLRSRFPDVRVFALGMLSQCPREENIAQEVMDAVLDESAPVRIAALRILALRRLEHAQEILLASLQDESHEIQEASVTSLLLLPPNGEIQEALAKWLPDGRQNPLARRVRTYLKRRVNAPPPARPPHPNHRQP
ncbi:MAG: HEAT repeat domain-containing protein [Victivallales bacterium]|nr:HEAT repeat domain-containing protein [Victivallales bacterium]